ncbi:MAG: hypothetical protein JWR37_987 [Mycobacterium sp.]|nr:hypothetical protein [Mycobacterium sp.]
MIFTALAREFDETMLRARACAARLGETAEQLDRLRGRARSPRGDAEAVVDGRGILVELELAASVARLPAEAVADLIVTTVAAAAEDARGRRQRILDELPGGLSE